MANPVKVKIHEDHISGVRIDLPRFETKDEAIKYLNTLVKDGFSVKSTYSTWD